MSTRTLTLAGLFALAAFAGCSAAPALTPSISPSQDASASVPAPSSTFSSIRLTLDCEKVPADVLARAKSVVNALEGSEPRGLGALVQGALTPGGHRWQIIAVNTGKGPKAVLRTLPASNAEHLEDGRPSGEFAPLSEEWSGDLAEFRGTLTDGARVRDAAFACLSR